VSARENIVANIAVERMVRDFTARSEAWAAADFPEADREDIEAEARVIILAVAERIAKLKTEFGPQPELERELAALSALIGSGMENAEEPVH
jgi:hypothetical protein